MKDSIYLNARRLLAAGMGRLSPKSALSSDTLGVPSLREITAVFSFQTVMSVGDEVTPLSFFLSGCQRDLNVCRTHPDYVQLRDLVLSLQYDDVVEVVYRVPDGAIVSLARSTKPSEWSNTRVRLAEA